MRFFPAAACLALLGLALADCGKKQPKETPEAKPEQTQVEESIIKTRADSIHWLGYLHDAPDDTALAYLMLGAFYLANDQPADALTFFQTASDYDPERAIIYLNIGDAYNRLGDYEKATEAFRTYLQRAPGGILSQEIFRIVEKYRSIQSETEIR